VMSLLPTPKASDGSNGGPGMRNRRGQVDALPAVAAAFGPYADAIARWENILGRPAPEPTHSGKLSPPFVEWMMGLPAGHVTDPGIGLTRTQQLKVLGNGVVPQQAASALRMLLRQGGTTAQPEPPAALLPTPNKKRRSHTLVDPHIERTGKMKRTFVAATAAAILLGGCSTSTTTTPADDLSATLAAINCTAVSQSPNSELELFVAEGGVCTLPSGNDLWFYRFANGDALTSWREAAELWGWDPAMSAQVGLIILSPDVSADLPAIKAALPN
jgi:hypothetical protein